MNFETKYNEVTNLWQYRGPEGPWSKPLRLAQLMQAFNREVAVEQAPLVERDWSKPLAHAVRRTRTMDEQAQARYEISGGKVQRIAFDEAERRQQQLAELADIMGMNE